MVKKQLMYFRYNTNNLKYNAIKSKIDRNNYYNGVKKIYHFCIDFRIYVALTMIHLQHEVYIIMEGLVYFSD